MLRTVEETAIQLGVSKTTIYNKLKMKEYKCILYITFVPKYN